MMESSDKLWTQYETLCFHTGAKFHVCVSFSCPLLVQIVVLVGWVLSCTVNWLLR